MPAIGSAAPAFSLLDTSRSQVSLADHRGKNVVIAFMPGAFTGVCTAEVCALRDSAAELNGLNATVIGITVDGPFANGAWASQNELNFPILSDHQRKAVSAYGVALPDFAGVTGYTAAQRAVFVVDGDGVVQWQWVAPNPGVAPDYDAIKQALSGL